MIAAAPPSAAALWRWGRLALAGAFALALALVLYLAWAAPERLPLVPAVLAAGGVLYGLSRHPLLNLAVVLGGFVLVVGYSRGLNLLEVLYGLYALGFLAHWFATRLLLYRADVLDTPEAKALFLFLVGMTASVALAAFYGAPPASILSEWTALVMIGFFFPVREACVRYRHGPAVLLLVLGWIGLYVAVRNALDYQSGLNNAKYLFQIAKGRVIMNDNLLMVVSFFTLTFMVFAPRRWQRLVLLVGFLVTFGGLILTQSRALWVAFLFGSALLFAFVPRRHKRRMLALGLASVVITVGAAYLLLGDVLPLIVAGLLDRAASLGQGVDMSLRSRLVEAQGAFAYIKRSPVLGLGLGTPFQYFDIITQTNVTRNFIHNGYVGLWYRFGVWGFALMLFFWVRSLGRGFALFRRAEAPLLLRTAALAAATCLATLLVTTNTSNPFFLKDSVFIFGFITGLIGGAHARAQRPAPGPLRPPSEATPA